MRVLVRDYETRSTLDLRRVGAWRYSRHASTDVWCCAYAVDDGEIKLWLPGDPVPAEFTEAAANPDYLVVAFNDGFERVIEQHIMSPRYGWPLVPIERHRCLQASALSLALPASLDGAAQALGLEHKKDAGGRRVMLQMAKPRKPRKDEDPTGVYWFDDEERRQLLFQYCRQDTAVERELHKRIGFLGDSEQAVWELDAAINDRGFYTDGALLEAAYKLVTGAEAAAQMEFRELTGLGSTNQIDAFIAWLAARGCEVKDATKGTLAHALRRNGLAPEVRRAIELRRQLAHASAGKVESLLAYRSDDGRVRGTLKYHGAAPGRWTGSGPQPQNFKRDTADADAKITAVMNGGDGLASPVETVGEIGRAMICAAPGHRLLVADFSGIESRVLAWLSRQQSKIDAWATFDRTGRAEDDPYVRIAQRCGLSGDCARDIGKRIDLAFGFGGSVGAWQRSAPEDDTTSEETAKGYRNVWKAEHPATVNFWYRLDKAAINAIKHPGLAFTVGRVAYRYDEPFLKLTLPSGRTIAYPFARITGADLYGNPTFTFLDNAGGKFTDCRFGNGAWFGMLVENIVQATARDLLAAALMRLEAAGYPVVLHVHDEAVCEAPIEFGDLEEFKRIVTIVPAWAEGLPIAAKVRNGLRFAKVDAPKASRPHVCARCGKMPDGCKCLDVIRQRMEEEGVPWTVTPQPNPQPELEPKPEPESQPKPDPEPRAASNGGGHHEHDFNDDYDNGPRSHTRIVKQYVYEDPAGRPYLRVNRTSTHRFFQEHWKDNRWVKGRPPGGPIPYRLPQLITAKPDELVVIAEGEKDTETAVALGFVATSNPGGAGKFTVGLARWFTGKQTVILCEDNDAAGRAHVAKTAAALHSVVPDIRIARFTELPEKGDLSDWVTKGHTRDDLIARAQPAPKPEVESILASDVEPAAVDWIWPGRFARGKLGIIAGLPDEGKGLLSYFIMSNITRGRGWPCGEGSAPLGNVILLTAEDDLNDTVIPRLIAAGADRARIKILRMVPTGDGKRMFSLVTDLEMLRQEIERMGDVQVIFIDPITAYLGVGQIDSFRTTDVRAVLAPMVDLAIELEVLIIVIMHFNKKLDVTNVLLRISDSLAFGATSRHCYAVVYDAENKRSLLVKGKNNHAPKDQKALAFTVEVGDGGVDKKTGATIEAPYIVFGSELVDVTAAEAMQAATEAKGPAARDAAKNFINDILGNGPVGSDDIEEAAKANGIAKRTLYRAKSELGVKAVKDGPMKDGQRTWQWHLPEKDS
jgi:DNA polymerase